MIKKKNNPLKTAQMVAIILLVVAVGCWVISSGLSYIYKEPLSFGSCGLCLNLNEELNICKEYLPFGITLNFTFENG